MIYFSYWMKLKLTVAWFLRLKHLLKEYVDNVENQKEKAKQACSENASMEQVSP